MTAIIPDKKSLIFFLFIIAESALAFFIFGKQVGYSLELLYSILILGLFLFSALLPLFFDQKYLYPNNAVGMLNLRILKWLVCPSFKKVKIFIVPFLLATLYYEYFSYAHFILMTYLFLPAFAVYLALKYKLLIPANASNFSIKKVWLFFVVILLFWIPLDWRFLPNGWMVGGKYIYHFNVLVGVIMVLCCFGMFWVFLI